MQIYNFEIENTPKLSEFELEYRLLDHWVAQMAITGFKICSLWDGALGGQVHKSLDIAKVAVGMGIPIPMGKGWEWDQNFPYGSHIDSHMGPHLDPHMESHMYSHVISYGSPLDKTIELSHYQIYHLNFNSWVGIRYIVARAANLPWEFLFPMPNGNWNHFPLWNSIWGPIWELILKSIGESLREPIWELLQNSCGIGLEMGNSRPQHVQLPLWPQLQPGHQGLKLSHEWLIEDIESLKQTL